ncbi:MAG: type IV secretion system DNA-binding domain-containing protein [Actinomycetota bacterium]|nr:type IV secretion system DNA-binding domain-containing protein [Actinomycetota bacterium]
MNPSTPSDPTSTSLPGGPLGRYLLHPDSDTSTVVHHVLHVLAGAGRTSVPFLVAVVALVIVARLVIAVTRRQRAGGGHVVTVAPGPEVEPAGAGALWNGLHGVLRRGGLAGLVSGRPHVAFEVGFSTGRLRFGLWVPATVSATRVARVVEAAWPGAVTEVVPAEAPLPGGAGITGGELRPAGPEWFSLRVDHPADPYRLLLAALSGLGIGEAGVVQVLARPATRRRYARCRKAAVALRTGRPRSKLVRFIDFWMTKGVPQRPSLSADPTRAGEVRAITEKAASLCFEATVRYGIVTPTGGHRARQPLRAEGHGIVGAFAMFDGRNHLTRKRLPRTWQALCARRFGRGDLYSVAELAALAHLPVDRSVAGLSRAGAHAVAPPPEVRGDGKVLGRAEGGSRRPVGVSVADARQHLHVLGATGSGKSTLLTNLVLQDVGAHRGAVVIDPKGDLINDLIDRLPAEVAGRVVILDPDDDTAPPAMNVLDAAEPHLAVDHLVGIFHRLFEAYWGPRTDDVLRVAALTALRQPGATLADIPRLLTEPGFRAALTRRLDDPTLAGFWQSYEQMSPAAQSQMVGPVMNKLRVVLTRPFVSAVLGSATSSFDLGTDVLDGGLLLARLPKGTLGEDSCRLLGSFVVAKVWQTVTARARHGQMARRDAALYLDEAQNFLTLPGSIGDMLAEARGYRLSVVAAHQHLSQLPRELRDALSANARNKVFFNCSPEDAHVLERHVAPELSEQDLSHLGAHQAAVRLVIDWEEAPAFTLRTEAAPDHEGNREVIRAAARERFGRNPSDRHDEDLRRRLAGRRGAGRHRSDSGVSADRSDGRPAGTSGCRPDLPGSPWAKRQHAGYLAPADGDPDSWSDL